MNWNDAIQQLAETHWLPMRGASAPFKEIRRKLIPGYRLYDCEECGHLGKQKTRDCHSPSHEICEMCHSDAKIINREEHPEWRVDKSGNLV